MRKIRWNWMLGGVVGLGLVACGRSTPPVAPVSDEVHEASAAAPQAQAVPAVEPSADDQPTEANGDTKPTFDEGTSEKAVIDYASCDLTPDGQLDELCWDADAYQSALRDPLAVKVMERSASAVGRRLISHASPSVRVKAADALMNIVAPSEADENALVAAARRETNSPALAGFIDVLYHNGAKNPNVAKLILWAADHDDPNVRMAAISTLSEPANGRLKGGVEKLIEIIDTEPETWLRDSACRLAGHLGDARLMPMYRRLTADKSDDELYVSCMVGLASMWWS